MGTKKEWRQDVMREFGDSLEKLNLPPDKRLEETLLLAETLEDADLDEIEGKREARERVSDLGGEWELEDDGRGDGAELRESGSDSLQDAPDLGLEPPPKRRKKRTARRGILYELDRIPKGWFVVGLLLVLAAALMVVIIGSLVTHFLDERGRQDPTVPDEAPGSSASLTLPEPSPLPVSDPPAESPSAEPSLDEPAPASTEPASHEPSPAPTTSDEPAPA